MKKSILILITATALLMGGCDNGSSSMDDTQMEPGTEMENMGEMASQPRGKDNPPTLGFQIDRTGRPAINTALNQTFAADEDFKGAEKDAYNAAGEDEWSSFIPSFAGSLAILDSLDTVCGNQLLADNSNEMGRYHTLAGILADDRLYVHADRGECGTYLGLEAEIVGAVEEGMGGCGGRTLKDDVIERSYSLLAAGILAGIDDGVTGDDVEHLDGFPFVGEPTLSL